MSIKHKPNLVFHVVCDWEGRQAPVGFDSVNHGEYNCTYTQVNMMRKPLMHFLLMVEEYSEDKF